MKKIKKCVPTSVCKPHYVKVHLRDPPITYCISRTSRQHPHSLWRIVDVCQAHARHFRLVYERVRCVEATVKPVALSALQVRGLSSGRCGQSLTTRLTRQECGPDGKVTKVR